MPGGQSSDGVAMEYEGGVKIAQNSTYLLFLPRQADDDGAFYPLAGYKAIATQQMDGSYILPSDVFIDGEAATRQFTLNDLR